MARTPPATRCHGDAAAAARVGTKSASVHALMWDSDGTLRGNETGGSGVDMGRDRAVGGSETVWDVGQGQDRTGRERQREGGTV